MMPNRYGYSLIELILTIAIIAILLGMSAMIYRPLYVRNELDVATHTLVLDLYRAQTLSRDGGKDDQWGVHISSTELTLFRGASYATRVSSDDEIYPLPASLSITGATDYMFAKFSGNPISTGTTTLAIVGVDPKVITLGAKGTVDY